MLYQTTITLGDTLGGIALLDSASKYIRHRDKNYHLELLQVAQYHKLEEAELHALNRLVRYYYFTKEYRLKRAKYYYAHQQFEDAHKDYYWLVKRYRKDGEIQHYFGKCCIETGKQKQGDKALEKAKKLGFRPPKG